MNRDFVDQYRAGFEHGSDLRPCIIGAPTWFLLGQREGKMNRIKIEPMLKMSRDIASNLAEEIDKMIFNIVKGAKP